MTCEELMALKSSGFEGHTLSLISAMSKHYQECAKCRAIIDASNASEPKTAQENELLDLAARAIALRLVTATDPELP